MAVVSDLRTLWLCLTLSYCLRFVSSSSSTSSPPLLLWASRDLKVEAPLLGKILQSDDLRQQVLDKIAHALPGGLWSLLLRCVVVVVLYYCCSVLLLWCVVVVILTWFIFAVVLFL